METDPQTAVQAAVQRGIESYIEACRARIPAFVEQHFSLRGALALHRHTFGRDFYKHPVNFLWGLPAVLVRGAGSLLGMAGARKTAAWLDKLPAGIPTQLQRDLEWLIYTELLQLPYAKDGRESRRDALLETILAEPEIAALCQPSLEALHRHAHTPGFRAALERNLAEYGKSRAALSELAGNLLNLAAGYAAAQQITPGTLSAGTAAATAIAQHLAVANFWLGPTLGSWYYAVFPAAASTGLVIATTGALLAAVGALTALSWVVIDPLLAKTGFHRRRLDRFVTALGEALRGQQGDYRLRDHYVARVFDLLDILRAAARAVG
ncbi:DUF6635 family protein [Candidatus Methylocalor cossyra]|uniref:Uncharacterized protein n=1 Tax=Candidatus Methylocalor cossyra TaxID=3108543 RepID=A0ABM9NG24_9GAMM